MAVTHTTVGFKGTVDQIGEARRMSRLGPLFAVATATDWVVSAASGDRTVSISAGSAETCGVVDTTTGADTLGSLPANGTSGTATRYDLIIARFKWTDPVTPVAFTYLQGTAGAGIPNVGGLVRTPGTQYDAVLAVVRVAGGQGALTANDIFDCRTWGGNAGPLQAATLHPYLLQVVDGAVGDELVVKAGTPVELFRRESTGWVPVRMSALYTLTPDANGVMIVPHQLGGTPVTWGATAGQQASDLLNRVGDVRVGNADAANVVVRFVRTDTSAPLDSLCVFHLYARRS